MFVFRAAFVDELTKIASRDLARQFVTSAGLTGAGTAVLSPDARAGDIARTTVGFGAGDVAGTVLARILGMKGGAEWVTGMLGGLYGAHKMQRKRPKARRLPPGTPHRYLTVDELRKVSAARARSYVTPASSNVKGFRYDAKTKSLFITFKSGGTYRYSDVPQTVARSLQRNKSVGKTVHRLVKKPGYEYEKVAGARARKITKKLLKALLEEKASESKSKEKKRKGKRRKKRRKKRVKTSAAKCKTCGAPATKGLVWAEGRAIAHTCDRCEAATRKKIGEKPVAVRDLRKEAAMNQFRLSFVDELVKLGNGDMIAYLRDHPKKLREKLERDKAKARRKAAKRAGSKGSASERFVQSRSSSKTAAPRPQRYRSKGYRIKGLVQAKFHDPRVMAQLAKATREPLKPVQIAVPKIAANVLGAMDEKHRAIAKLAGEAKKQVNCLPSEVRVL